MANCLPFRELSSEEFARGCFAGVVKKHQGFSPSWGPLGPRRAVKNRGGFSTPVVVSGRPAVGRVNGVRSFIAPLGFTSGRDTRGLVRPGRTEGASLGEDALREEFSR